MARIVQFSILSSLKGNVGEIEVKRTRHGIVVARRRGKRKKKPAGAQKASCDKFTKAVAHARKVLADFKRENPNIGTVKKRRSVYHKAIADFMKKSS